MPFEAKPAIMRTALFTMESLGQETFEGYTQGDTWNGWECPLFPLESAKRVVEAYEGRGQEASFDVENNVFRFMDEESGEVEEFGAIEVEGRNLYPIGAGVWIWELAARVERIEV